MSELWNKKSQWPFFLFTSGNKRPYTTDADSVKHVMQSAAVIHFGNVLNCHQFWILKKLETNFTLLVSFYHLENLHSKQFVFYVYTIL